MILTILQLFIFVTYVGYICYRFGVLPSISESHYKLNEVRSGYLFTLFCWALAITMVFQSNESSPLYFFSGVGLAFVGAAAQFKWTGANIHIVHYLGAFVGIAAALAGLYFESELWQPSIIFTTSVIIIVLGKVKNPTFWIEIVAFLVIITGLLVR